MINMKEICYDEHLPESFDYLPDVLVDPNNIKIVMINEIVPQDTMDDFYANPNRMYAKSVQALFDEITTDATPLALLDHGIYMCNAIKCPKQTTTIPKETILAYSYMLEKELAVFNNLSVVMAMGDVAKKSLNFIAKRQGLKAVFPAGSTYKQRGQTFYFHDALAMPCYIMTGENIKIEKSKFAMNSEDIRNVWAMITP